MTRLGQMLWKMDGTYLSINFLTRVTYRLQREASCIDDIQFEVYVAYEDDYVQPLILSALSSYRQARVLPKPSSGQKGRWSLPSLQISTYESIDHPKLLSMQTTYFANAYTIRKAIIRKHFLANTIQHYVSKNPSCALKQHVPITLSLELDYAEFLDEALLEAYELHESWARNEHQHTEDKDWWILKPSMSDKGHGIRLFSTESELRAIFEEWEPSADDEAEDEARIDESELLQANVSLDLNLRRSPSTTGMTSQLRHFVVQLYIAPLLFPTLRSSKFHVRTYVLCVGALRVYVYKEMLALFAQAPYTAPQSETAIEMEAHLTNTGLQKGDTSNSVHRFWDLPEHIPGQINRCGSWQDSAFEDIKAVTRDLFEAAVAQPTNFQPLPNAFEIFGIDWLVDASGNPWLLEVNAFPDFGQTGTHLKETINGLWTETMGLVSKEFFGINTKVTDSRMVSVLDRDIGRK